MYRHRIALTAVILLAGSSAHGADEVKALIDRARRASGDDGWQEAPGAHYRRSQGTVKGKLFWVKVLEGRLDEESYLEASGRVRRVTSFNSPNKHLQFYSIVNGKKGWRTKPGTGELERIPVEELAPRRSSIVIDGPHGLKHFLEDRSFTLTAVGESRFEGRAVLGIRASRPPQKDAFLYFDKQTGLLAGCVHYTDENGGKHGTRHEVLFLDYWEPDSGEEDRRILDKAGLDTSSASLLIFLRAQGSPRFAREQARKLVPKLGDSSFAVREQASKDLRVLGRAALPVLEEAGQSTDVEVRRRARSCQTRIKARASDETLSLAAVSLLAVRRPPGAANVLLDLLPRARPSVASAARAVLYHLGEGSRKPDPELLAVLEHSDPERRAAAEAALGRDGGAYARLPNRRVFRPGLKIPRKTILLSDTMRQELEALEERFYNRFDDKLFLPPDLEKP